jgi:hypothetical protein
MTARLELPIALAPAARFALAHQADHLSQQFIAAIRAGHRSSHGCRWRCWRSAAASGPRSTVTPC